MAAVERVEITRHALDKVPLSLIVDDSAPVVNLNHFFLRDRIRHTGQYQRWEDVPVSIPEAFTREWAEWCAAHGVKGKYSVVPCPAGIGRIDQGLPLFDRQQLESWLAVCRETIVPNFDVTPEMLTHTFILDPETLKPLPDRPWEQYEWRSFGEGEAERVGTYIELACRILANVDLPPQGVTSPGGFGGQSLPLYVRLAGEAVRRVTGNPTPYVFQRVSANSEDRGLATGDDKRLGSVPGGRPVDTPVWYADRVAGTAVGEAIACVGDHTGSWTGYGEADPDRYITEDLQGGRLVQVIGNGDPCILVSHWQGFYGMHDDDRRGFRALQIVVDRLRQLDPWGERTVWRKTSEITTYSCMRALAKVDVAASDDGSIGVKLDLPLRMPELTLRLTGLGAGRERRVCVDGRPLDRAASRAAFRSGTYVLEEDALLLAFDPAARRSVVELDVPR
ncbi:MAG TPA: hypothetical protein VFX49_19925 [Chloroflexota bacterium]|nr:hypothetical protein [Chloroflexota bacterium]